MKSMQHMQDEDDIETIDTMDGQVVSRCHRKNDGAGAVAAAAVGAVLAVAAVKYLRKDCSHGEHPDPAAVPTVQGPENPGGRAWFSQALFDHVEALTARIVHRINGMQVENQKQCFANLCIEMTNIVLEIDEPGSLLELTLHGGPPGMRAKLIIPDGEFKFNYTASVDVLVGKVKFHGSGTCKIVEGDVLADVEFYTDKGYPQIRLQNVEIDLQLGDIKMTGILGIPAWIGNKVIDAINAIFKGLVPLAEMALVHFADDTVNEMIMSAYDPLGHELSVFGVPAPYGSLTLDYYAIAFAQSFIDPSDWNSIGLGFTLAPGCSLDKSIYYPNTANPMSEAPPHKADSSRMLAASVSPWVVNGLLWFCVQEGFNSYTIRPEDIPDSSPVQLNTNTFLTIAPGLIFYPCKPMTITCTTDGDPVLSLVKVVEDQPLDQVSLHVPAVFKFNILEGNGEETFAFSLTCPVVALCQLIVEQPEDPNAKNATQKFLAQITTVSITPVCVGESNVGPINCFLTRGLGRILQPLMVSTIVPILNQRLADYALDIPHIFKDTSVEVDYTGNALRVFSDVDLSSLSPIFDQVLMMEGHETSINERKQRLAQEKPVKNTKRELTKKELKALEKVLPTIDKAVQQKLKELGESRTGRNK